MVGAASSPDAGSITGLDPVALARKVVLERTKYSSPTHSQFATLNSSHETPILSAEKPTIG